MAERNDGRSLEAAVGRFFGENGYIVELNVVAEGRSGGRHEIDVLAEKSDALTTFRVAVECKAWAQPIQKDVVSKLHYVIGDLGLNKGIIVSTAGCRAGADHAAKELGIELWGQDELRHFLGSSAISRLEVQDERVEDRSLGWSFVTPDVHALKRADLAAQGSRVFRRREKVDGLCALWLPAYVVTLRVAQPRKRAATEVVSKILHNLYDSVTGTLIATNPGTPVQVEVSDGTPVDGAITPSKITSPIVKTYERYSKVTSLAATDRHAWTLRTLGVPTPCYGLTVEEVLSVRYPIWCAMLRLREVERLVAISGRTGELLTPLSNEMTSSINHFRYALSDE